MLLAQDDKGYWTRSAVDPTLYLRTHRPSECADHPCAIHGTESQHPLSKFPLNWREDAGKLERICSHGIGHDDYDSVQYLESINPRHSSLHTCDGCCMVDTEEIDNIMLSNN